MNRDTDDTVISIAGAAAAGVSDLDALGDTVILAGRDRAAEASPFAATAAGSPVAATAAASPIDPPAVLTEFAVRIGSTVIGSLQVPVIVGRRPRTPRIVSGPPPRLVTVDSPKKEVSKSHLSIRQLGSSLVITDLRSTNGSVVTVPGSVPRRLRQGESVVVTAGATVDVGDGTVVEVLRADAVAVAGSAS